MASVLGAVKNLPASISPICRTFLRIKHPLIDSYRTTWVLRRRIPPTNVPRTVDPHWLKDKLEPIHQEYEVVVEGFRDNGDYPPVKLVLTEVIEDVGQRGQIVDLSPMEAYELVILGQAMYATPDNLAKIKLLKESDMSQYSSLTAFKTIKKLSNMNLPVFMNMHEPWTVEPWHIRVNFRLNGIQMLADDCVELPEQPSGPNLDLEGKDFVAYVTINKSDKFPVRCRLRHFTKIYHKRVMLAPDHMCVPSVPIYPEQKEILDSIPLPKPPEDDKTV